MPAGADRAHLRGGRRRRRRSRSARATRAGIPALLHLDGDLEVLVGGDDWALEGFAAGATGWITGVGVLAPARDASSSTTPCRAGDLARGARRVPSAAARRPLRHDPQARPVLQGRPGRRRLQRRPDARAAPAAEGRRGRRARGGARDPARAAPSRECAPPATSRPSTPTRRGCRRASSPAASARSPGATMLERKLHFEARAGRAAAAADARAARPRRDVGGDPAAPGARRRRLGRALHRGLRAAADVRARDDRRRHRAGRDRHGRGHRARDRDPARRPRGPGRGARAGRERPRAVGDDPQRPVVPARARPRRRRPGLRRDHLRHGLRRQLLRDHAGGGRGPGRRPGAHAAS